MGKIKILELLSDGGYGSPRAQILSLLRHADRDRFQISVAAHGKEILEKDVRSSGFSFYDLDLPKILRSRFLSRLQNLYFKERFDIIHSYGAIGGFYGRLLKKHEPSVKCVHTIHGINYLNKERFFQKNISKTIEQYLVQFTDMTICESLNEMKIAFENKIANPKNTIVVNPGVDIRKFSANSTNIELLNELGLNPGDFIVGNVSRFEIQKNQKLIIQASYYLSKKYPEMKFVLVGDGKYFKQMKSYARDSRLEDVVIFAGERENIVDYYSIFDVFVLPSFWEGVPSVLLEAMASKLPIVCSNLANHLEIIKNNISAFTINPYEMEDLFHRIKVLYENAELRNKLRENAFEDVQNFDEKDHVKKILKVYTEVMED
ncbi:MAG: glycosyltransferase [Ignavibacteria bacterium]